MKYKKLTREQILISLDRLTRFKQTREKYLRVFFDIISNNLLEPKYKRSDLENLKAEEITIQRFFENNLNVSETSRGLFVHRNTLVYRLEKIKKLTGLDLREFDDAIVFKVALMVKKYLSANPAKY